MAELTEFQRSVHQCNQCRDYGLTVVEKYPVISFGDLTGKPVLVVGINPSSREYEGYLDKSPDPETRHRSQMQYFDNKVYSFFDKLGRFFDGPAKKVIQWEKSPWEKVGITDMVKCPTRNTKGQWRKILPSERKQITELCRKYLAHQLHEISLKIIMAYGADVCRWFYSDYTMADAFTSREFLIDGKPRHLLLVPQVQGAHQPRIVQLVQKEIALGLVE